MVYVRNCLNSMQLTKINTCAGIESVWLDIHPDKNPNHTFRVGVFYRPPSQSRKLDDAMIKEIDNGTTRRTILIGDFNLPKFVQDSDCLDKTTCNFKHCFEESFLMQMVTEPTRNNEILDLVLISEDLSINNLNVGEQIGTSDHNIIRFDVLINHNMKPNSNKTYMPNFCRADFEGLRLLMRQINWEHEFEGRDALSMWEIFKNIILESESYFVPLKQIRKKKK